MIVAQARARLIKIAFRDVAGPSGPSLIIARQGRERGGGMSVDRVRIGRGRRRGDAGRHGRLDPGNRVISANQGKQRHAGIAPASPSVSNFLKSDHPSSALKSGATARQTTLLPPRYNELIFISISGRSFLTLAPRSGA